MSIDHRATLSELVTADPRRARVLETFGLDYCCHGERPLDEATVEAGLDVAAVSAALDIADVVAAVAPAGPTQNAALAHDIVDAHHAYMWEEMPRLRALVEKVATVHGTRHPELAQVQSDFEQVVAELDPHMTREERVVFPAIARMEKTQQPAPSGSLVESIGQLRAEHDAVGALFKHIRSTTDGYAVPADACNSYRAMLTGLQEMELDLHQHIHKENNILFPRAVDMERELPTRQPPLRSAATADSVARPA
jgi:regulator of cell morphogenesis and NO signaling